MNKVLVTAAAFALMCGASLAQGTLKATVQDAPQAQAPTTAAPASQQTPQPEARRAGSAQQSVSKPRIAPGSVIPVQLTKTVDAKKVKTGEEVVAKVTQDMKTQSGEVLVPKDTKVIGHVTEAQARNKEQKESELAISFDQAVLNGSSVQLPMSIQAIIGQQQNNNNANASGGASDQGAAGVPAGGGGAPAGGSAGRTGAMGTGTPPPNTAPGAGAGTPPPDQSNNPAHPVINAQTQGVIGISNMTLAPAPNANQGSLMTSEKNNVKLESGTMLLLKVKQQ
jgi:hypothetical protein